MNARWPKPLDDPFKEHYSLDESDERFVTAKYDLVTQGRNLRREANIPAAKKVRFVLKPLSDLPAREMDVLRLLLNAESLEANSGYQPPTGTPSVHSDLGELYMPVEGLVDVTAERARLEKELAKYAAEEEKVQSKLQNPAFTQKVPPAVLEEHQKRLADWQAKAARVKAALNALR
jgi:valyl-tRNA synthetase